MKEYNEIFGSNLPEDFTNPDCDEDGYFKLWQCAALMGCYCVDRYTGEPTSKSSEESPLPTDCQKLAVTVSSRETASLPTSRKLPTSQSTTERMSPITAYSTGPGGRLRFVYPRYIYVCLSVVRFRAECSGIIGEQRCKIFQDQLFTFERYA